MSNVAVPLVRPNMPPLSELEPFLAVSREAGQWSNFGPLWQRAAAQLSALSGRLAFPCSSGTDAVLLALVAAQPAYVAYEAFTFQATKLAVQRYADGAGSLPLRTGAKDERATSGERLETAIVRTIPFGASRRFPADSPSQLIIDAAGAFGPSALDQFPEDAIVAVSFHATKNFPIGEGGCVFLPPHMARQGRLVRAAMNFGIDPDTRENLRFLHAAGNYKLDELHCALLLRQLGRSDVFAERSERIAHESKLLAECKDCSLPYTPGHWQSLTVVAHRNPEALVARLTGAGFAARRVYHPYINEDFLTYDEAHLVALPSDCTNDEFWTMHKEINAL